MVSSIFQPVQGKCVQYPQPRKTGWSPDPVGTLSRKKKKISCPYCCDSTWEFRVLSKF